MEIFGAINTAATLQSSSIWQKIISRNLVPLASPGLYICMWFRNIPESTDRSNRGQQLVEMTQIVCQLFLPILPVRYFMNNPVMLYLQHSNQESQKHQISWNYFLWNTTTSLQVGGEKLPRILGGKKRHNKSFFFKWKYVAVY